VRRPIIVVVALALLAGCARPASLTEAEAPVAFSRLDAEVPGAAPPVALRVTAERLAAARAEPQNWLTYYGAYDGHRYSGLDQVRRDNVKRLAVAWTFQRPPLGLIAAPPAYAFEATPIVVDGVMYVTGPDGMVWALDAASGKTLWEYHHAVPLDTPLCCGNVNRGVAVAAGKVFVVTPHGHLLALDAGSGRPLWQTVFADVRAGESATLAPLVVKRLVLVGTSGGEYGIRGHVDAFEIETGRRAWRRYTIPKPGEPGSETWAGDAWQRGGGPTWVTGTYDPALNLVFWGVGNPGPDYDGTVREGANLFTDSVLALDPDDGTIRWHYQWTPHDVWDYDGVNENILIDDGSRRLLAHFDKNGYLFLLNRVSGKLVRAVPYARATWGDIERDTGKVTVRLTPTVQGAEICPGPAGAKEWVHASYSEKTRLLYVPVIERCAVYRTRPSRFREGITYWGGESTPRKQGAGVLKAFDLEGREVWAKPARFPIVGSVLSTAGDVVFVGHATGEFAAYDARSGDLLWQFSTGSGIRGGPITYSVNGKQYVAVPSGWGGWLKGFAPELYGAPRGMALFSFALP
jgi:alcohol dehydrogenase (cytochrome c)